MKNFKLKPSFEFIFSLSLIAVLALPPIVVGQNHKELDITITNGDTVINGKNIKDLAPMERKQALKDINSVKGEGAGARGGMLMQHRELMSNDRQRVIIQQRMTDDMPPMANNGKMGTDSAHYTFRYRLRGGNGKDSIKTLDFQGRSIDRDNMRRDAPMYSGGDGMIRSDFGRRGFNRRNTQNFTFMNTDANGITTHLSINVSEPRGDDLKNISGSDKNDLELIDLTLVPEFSAGRILLMFDLPSKVLADVKMMDSEGKILWTEKVAGGSLKKSFALGLNGVYYLKVKQADKVVVKRIVKEE